ncbi:MAG TPA: MerR family transcriptional regulator [Actinomycetota bacterium]|nr:MerR family transcriptional regulator [Actinomycetota bacterium]
MSEWDRQTTPGGAEGPQWVSAAEAADVAGVTPGTVRYWARNGLIVSEVVDGPGGERTLVRLDEVLQHARQEGGSRGGAPPRGPAAPPGEVVTDLPARTSELAPILKSIPEIMAQLTAATDRAARAETKVEFLSAQLADLRRRLAEAEQQRDAAAAAREAAAEVTLPEAWETPETPEEPASPAAGWPTPPADELRDEPVAEPPEPGPHLVDWTAGDPDALPGVEGEAEALEPPDEHGTREDRGLSLDDIWSQTAQPPPPPGGEDAAPEVDWHEPARGAPAPPETTGEESPVATPRPANAPVPEGDDFYGPRRRRWFRRRR